MQHARTPAPPFPEPSVPGRGAEIDESHIRRLISLVGPDQALELLHRLNADLLRVQAGLTRGFVGPDWPALRTHSHVLAALAGTVGAQPLHDMSMALNQRAHNRDLPGLPDLQDAMMPQLAGLIAFVGQHRDQITAPR
ncbi:MAG: hypothetical protein U1D35_07820 [Paracoccaceae bacterium]|nr:hypothetical protein [Paracoccaceae bacterium]